MNTDPVRAAIDEREARLAETLLRGLAFTNYRYHGPTYARGSRVSFNVVDAELGFIPDDDVRLIAAKLHGTVTERQRADVGGSDLFVWVSFPYGGLRQLAESTFPGVRILIDHHAR